MPDPSRWWHYAEIFRAPFNLFPFIIDILLCKTVLWLNDARNLNKFFVARLFDNTSGMHGHCTFFTTGASLSAALWSHRSCHSRQTTKCFQKACEGSVGLILDQLLGGTDRLQTPPALRLQVQRRRGQSAERYGQVLPPTARQRVVWQPTQDLGRVAGAWLWVRTCKSRAGVWQRGGRDTPALQGGVRHRRQYHLRRLQPQPVTAQSLSSPTPKTSCSPFVTLLSVRPYV